MAADILIWWLTIQGFGLAGLPLARWLFRSLPDRGYAFAKSLGLLLAGYLAWLLAMLGLAPFGRPLVIICALAAGLAGLLIGKEPRTQDQEPRTQNPEPRTPRPSPITQNLASIRDWLVAEWRLVLAYEALFALALVFLALLRSYNPAPWGTERPMDYALFNAIRISPSFPPHDPWLSGYSINYYYFGYLLMAAVSLASGIGAGTAYNLSLALIFALTALGVAGLVVNLIGLHQGEEPRTKNQEPRRRQSVLISWLLVLLAVVLVLGVGNQGGALELISGTPKILELTQRDFLRAVSNGVGARAPLALDQPYKAWGDQNITTAITPTEQAGDFNWWNPSRALWDSARDPDDPTRFYAITEFPFFSFWLGDMHPHVMSLPFTLLALALALQTLARPSAPSYTAGQRGWAELALTGIVLGSLYLINSWDLPTYLLLYLAALVLLYVRLGAPPGPGGEARPPLARVWWRHLLPQAAAVLLAAWMLFAPFHLTFKSLVGGKEPLIAAPVLATITRTIGFVTWTKTSLHSFLIIFGLFLVPLVAFLLAQGRGSSVRSGLWRYPWAVLLGTLAFGLAIGFPLLVLLPLALYAAALALERAECPADAFALAGFALICLVCLGTEVIYIRDVFEMRMNTIFKFYYQAWLVWGLLAGYAAWRLVGMVTENREPRTESRARREAAGSRFLVLGSAILFAVFLVGALVYPWMTAGKSFREGQRSGLDGKTPTERTPEGAASIEWLRANVPGDAVVLEAVGDDYDGRGIGANGVSASTGLATVLGWPGHQDQWRGGDPAVHALIDPRKADVAAIYSSTDTAATHELLKKYSVDYIYVGPAERATYPAEGFAKFDQLGDPVFQQGDVTIYRVK